MDIRYPSLNTVHISILKSDIFFSPKPILWFFQIVLSSDIVRYVKFLSDAKVLDDSEPG